MFQMKVEILYHTCGLFFFPTEFYKDGKYDLDFKNPQSDPAKWVCRLIIILLLPMNYYCAKELEKNDID